MDLGSLLRLNHLIKLNDCDSAIDFVDKLNYQYTGGILLFLIGLISARQCFGKPIQCWVPVHYSRAWTEYAEDVCWAQNTYFLPSNKSIPKTEEDINQQRFVTYYQWVTIFLGIQAVFSYLPYLIWFISTKRFMGLLVTLKKGYLMDKETRKRSVTLLSGEFEEKFDNNSRKSVSLNKFAFQGTVCSWFFISRFMCIGFNCCQLYLMKIFLGMENIFFGVNILMNVIQGFQWESSGHFPRVTICRFEIRKWKPLTPEIETVQCALTINYFFEKMYVFLWFWFMTAIVVTIFNTIMWIIRIYYSYYSHKFIRRYIITLKSLSKHDKSDCQKFIRLFLGFDGVFLLLSISTTVSDLIVFEVVCKFWDLFRQLNEMKNKSENLKMNDNESCTGVV